MVKGYYIYNVSKSFPAKLFNGSLTYLWKFEIGKTLIFSKMPIWFGSKSVIICAQLSPAIRENVANLVLLQTQLDKGDNISKTFEDQNLKHK